MQVNFPGEKPGETEGETMVRSLQASGHEVDRKLGESAIRLYQGSTPVTGVGSQFDLAFQDDGPSEDEESSSDDSLGNSDEAASSDEGWLWMVF